jgi:hypothetical protein
MNDRKSKANGKAPADKTSKIPEEAAKLATQASAAPVAKRHDPNSWMDEMAEEVRDRLNQASHLGISVIPVLGACDWEEIVHYANERDIGLDDAIASLIVDGLMANRRSRFEVA